MFWSPLSCCFPTSTPSTPPRPTPRLQETRARREANRKRKAENELKSSTYQIVTDSKTIKKMNKKQLRSLKRMRVNSDGVAELADPYAK